MTDPSKKLTREKLIEVFVGEQESEALVVRGLLEQAGIEVLWTNYDAPSDVLPGVGAIKLQVRHDQAQEAKAILKEYKR